MSITVGRVQAEIGQKSVKVSKSLTVVWVIKLHEIVGETFTTVNNFFKTRKEALVYAHQHYRGRDKWTEKKCIKRLN